MLFDTPLLNVQSEPVADSTSSAAQAKKRKRSNSSTSNGKDELTQKGAVNLEKLMKTMKKIDGASSGSNMTPIGVRGEGGAAANQGKGKGKAKGKNDTKGKGKGKGNAQADDRGKNASRVKGNPRSRSSNRKRKLIRLLQNLRNLRHSSALPPLFLPVLLQNHSYIPLPTLLRPGNLLPLLKPLCKLNFARNSLEASSAC